MNDEKMKQVKNYSSQTSMIELRDKMDSIIENKNVIHEITR